MFTACEEDNKEISPSVIQFTARVQNVPEGDDVIILLMLDKPAPQNGSVELTFEGSAIYDQHWVTAPTPASSWGAPGVVRYDQHYVTASGPSNGSIVLSIYKGHKSTAFRIASVDNAKFEGSHFIIFKLNAPAEAFRAGDMATLTVVIADDEGPSLANFEVPSANVNEQDENGTVVNIPFTAPAIGEGSLTVAVEPGKSVRGTNFTINQELTNNSMSFNVARNSSGVSFKVFPVDNDLFTGNFILRFAIADISGVLQKGDNLSYSLTLADDEAPSVARFALPSGTIEESGTDGIMVEIPLSSPVKGEGTIAITLDPENLIYGTDFTTVPEAQNNRLILNLSHNQTGASFTVFPIDDDVPTGDEILSFSIHEATGVVWKGSDRLTYKLTIVDDD